VRLVDLNPVFLDAGGEGVYQRDPATGQLEPVPRRIGVGVQLDCPCGCGSPLYVPFRQPLDGGAARDESKPLWDRTGETFDTLTLSPSILRTKPPGCGWHGWITDGEVKTA